MRIIEAPDLHYDPRWADHTEACVDAIIAERPDVILLAGDLFNRPLTATEKGGYNRLRSLVAKMTAVATVIAIEGTPSHDGPGCYDGLTDLGLVLLRPHMHHDAHGIRFFGIPELNKSNILSRLTTSSERASASAREALKAYVLEYIAPLAQELPSWGLIHGAITDTEQDNTSDIVVKASDIVINTHDLSPAGLMRWTFGHFHTPWESSIINGGYGGFTGMDDNPWGKLGFKPGLWVRDDAGQVIKRAEYPAPMRVKITKPLSHYDKAVAYWLSTGDATAACPDGHPWSRVTVDETRTQTRRATQEQIERTKSLRELVQLFDTALSASILDKIDQIEHESPAKDDRRLSVRLKSLVVKGCTFFPGGSINLDLDTRPDDVIALHGANGSGKSSTLSFCSPYPLVIGKDTKSGRDSAIKDFFTGSESLIEKRFDVNGTEHRHLITIKAAHTKSPKTECYLYVDGKNQLDTTSFDEMMQTCERLYGPYMDYLLTTFYVQPLQGTKYPTGLMTAGMTEIRNLVQAIAGKDRETEKRYALDQVDRHKKQVEEKTTWIAGAGSFDVDTADLEETIGIIQHRLVHLGALGAQKKEDLAELEAKLDTLRERLRASKAQAQQKKDDEAELSGINVKIAAMQDKIKAMGELAGQVEALQARMTKALEIQERNQVTRGAQLRNQEKRQGYEADLRDIKRLEADLKLYTAELAEAEATNRKAQALIDTRDALTLELEAARQSEKAKARITAIEAGIRSIENPCPKCGYIQDQDRIDDLRHEAAALEGALRPQLDIHSIMTRKAQADAASLLDTERLRRSIDATHAELAMTVAVEPEYEPEPELMDHDDIADLQRKIRHGADSVAGIAAARADIKSMQARAEELQRKTYAIDTEVETTLHRATMDHAELRHQVDELRDQYSEAQGQLAGKRAELAKALEVKGKIKAAKEELARLEVELEDWKKVAVVFQSNKLPAFELELVLDAIDGEASRLMEVYEQGRYSFRTITQADNGVDRFDIMVHDNHTGREKSFLEFNPGHKAFLNDTYVKALISQRHGKSYSPVILDESDGPIQPERIADYYSIQGQYWTGRQVLVVSHSPTSHEYIQERIEMEEIYE